MTDNRRWLTAAILASGAGLTARRRDALSSSGAVGAATVGTAVFGAGGPRASALLLIFFGSSTLLSRSSRRDTTAKTQARDQSGPRRTLAQVFANGGVPAALALLSLRDRSPRVMAAYAGALAAANADTWATEIGQRSAIPPRMITTGQTAPPGVSGAITPLGLVASLAGAGLVSVTSAALYRRHPAHALGIVAAGTAGSLADSILGATLQAVYVCRRCAQRTEDRGHRHDDSPPALTLVRGLPIMTNDTVNLCASLTGATIGAIFGDLALTRGMSAPDDE